MRQIAQKRGVEVIDGVAEAIPCGNEQFDFVLMVTYYRCVSFPFVYCAQRERNLTMMPTRIISRPLWNIHSSLLTLKYGLMGAVLGYFVIHPLVMISSHIMFEGMFDHTCTLAEFIVKTHCQTISPFSLHH